MNLRNLELDEFRSFRMLRLPIEPSGFRAIGPNASGKSTILEAISMLATTRSPRTAAERDIANWESGEELAVPPYARLRGEFERSDGAHQLEIGLSLQERKQGALKKLVRFDDRPVRAIDAVGQLKCVLFSPEDVNLISGAPSIRRRYLDLATSQASRAYLRGLSRYGRVLEQRNSLLRTFSRDRNSGGSSRPGQELPFWDAELTAAATEVLAYRLGAVVALSARARYHFQHLTGDGSLTITYAPSGFELPDMDISNENWRSPSQSTRQMLSATFARILSSNVSEELRRGVTVVGPHRDDLVVSANQADLGRYGSRGQQRLAVVAIKLAELDLLAEAAGEQPILLLDDVLSELDAAHREKIVDALACRSAQICVTATDEADLGSQKLAHLPILQSQGGTVEVVHSR
jgi:DNA replication and repair protein RecF